ncbi:uncharacterized protein LOC117173213 [Belonocnema kinseyi]|uniref:uncharacterized protein LOC117173213 n=1 Tax=Belonocnema kinseyi TaxID=2817044 RepID=UPI00143D3056|nr:uncharacterized protein LOC117173213 [Belonocnema kinseyi]
MKGTIASLFISSAVFFHSIELSSQVFQKYHQAAPERARRRQEREAALAAAASEIQAEGTSSEIHAAGPSEIHSEGTSEIHGEGPSSEIVAVETSEPQRPPVYLPPQVDLSYLPDLVIPTGRELIYKKYILGVHVPDGEDGGIRYYSLHGDIVILKTKKKLDRNHPEQVYETKRVNGSKWLKYLVKFSIQEGTGVWVCQSAFLYLISQNKEVRRPQWLIENAAGFSFRRGTGSTSLPLITTVPSPSRLDSLPSIRESLPRLGETLPGIIGSEAMDPQCIPLMSQRLSSSRSASARLRAPSDAARLPSCLPSLRIGGRSLSSRRDSGSLARPQTPASSIRRNIASLFRASRNN